ncbi:MAG: type II secretion system protein GspL [Pseudomonadota bacterium]
MTDRLIMRLGATPDDQIAWSSVEAGLMGEVHQSPTLAIAAEEIAEITSEDVEITAIIQGEFVACRKFEAAPRSAKKFISAANLMLEDELASPVDNLHIAVGHIGDNGWVYAMDRSYLRNWLDGFAENDLLVRSLIADFHCLSADPDRLTVFIEEDRVAAASNTHGFAAEADIALAAVAQCIVEAPANPIRVYGELPSQKGDGGLQFERCGPADAECLIELAGHRFEKGEVVNLLQAEFRPPRRKIVDVKQWTRPAAMAAALMGTFLALIVADGIRAGRISDQYTDQAQLVLDRTFPDAAGSDPRSYARSVLSQGQAGASFLTLSATVSEVVSKHDKVSIDRIRFDAGRRQFVFSVRSNSDAEIETFRSSLASKGIAVLDTGGYRRSGAAWVGDMTVRLSS